VAKRENPHLAAWQEAARERLRLVCERKYHGRQNPLANALGVSHTLVSLVLRSVQPPTRNLMARLGSIDGVNPRWADTGEGEPFVPDARGTLPVSDVLLSGVPADYAALMTGERFAVAPAFDRPSCYLWRLPAGHPAVTVDAWRLRPGDLLLLETSREVTDVPAMFAGRMCALVGSCLDRAEPVYGEVTPDEKSRLVFGTPGPILRFDDLPRSFFEPSDAPVPRTRSLSKTRRNVMNLGKRATRASEQAADPWNGLPAFNVTHVLAVQLLMVRP
jgi:hypothetical protein